MFRVFLQWETSSHSVQSVLIVLSVQSVLIVLSVQSVNSIQLSNNRVECTKC